MNFCIGDMRRSVTCIMTDILDKCIGTFGQIIAPYVLQISLLIFAQKRCTLYYWSMKYDFFKREFQRGRWILLYLKKWFLQLFLLLKIYEWVASLYMDVQGCKIDTNLYFLCICRCGRHKMYAKLITNVDECVGPM